MSSPQSESLLKGELMTLVIYFLSLLVTRILPACKDGSSKQKDT